MQHSAALASAPARSFTTGAQPPAAKSDSAPAAASDFDWDQLEDAAASDNGKRELQLLRSTFLDVQQKITDMTKEPEAIKWKQWKEDGVDPQLVDAFQKAYDSMPLPKYEDTGLGELNQSFDDLLKQAGELAAHSETRMKEIQQEIAGIDKELDKVKTLTIDEVLESDPELGKRLHAEISEGKFIP
jgi:hypothetical protein